MRFLVVCDCVLASVPTILLFCMRSIPSCSPAFVSALTERLSSTIPLPPSEPRLLMRTVYLRGWRTVPAGSGEGARGRAWAWRLRPAATDSSQQCGTPRVTLLRSGGRRQVRQRPRGPAAEAAVAAGLPLATTPTTIDPATAAHIVQLPPAKRDAAAALQLAREAVNDRGAAQGGFTPGS